jgi:16S rRNA (adenine(1408)-N(1))-methyltransferase
MDATCEHLADYSARIGKKPSRGGLPNALYVLANAESLLPELAARASDITINFPWSSLLAELVLGEPQLLASITRIARPGASLNIIINLAAFAPPVPLELRAIPVPTVEYISTVLKPHYAACGINIQHVEIMGKQEMLRIGSDWAQRLAYGRAPQAVHISAMINPCAEPVGVGLADERKAQ